MSISNDDEVSNLAKNPSSETSPITVLHVDDQENFLDMAVEFLEREHDSIDVETATSAATGLESLSNGDIDCIVSDYQMPEMDGIEFLQSVRAKHPELPFILFTGKGSEEIASDAISAGVTDYLQKQPNSDQFAILANRIENAVHQARTQKRFEESQRRFQTLLSNLPGMVYRCEYERGWPMIFVSDESTALTGHDPSELVAENVSYGADVVHPDDRDRVWNTVREAVEAREPFRIEYRIRTADGEEKWVWEQGRGVIDNGDVDALEGFITDITNRKESEMDLEYQSSLLEAQMETTIDGLLVVDEDRNVVSYNEQFIEMWEIPDKFVETESDEALLDWVVDNQLADPQEFLDRVEELYDHPEQTSRDEVQLIDGRVFDRYSAPVIGDDGTNYGRLWMFRDITVNKEREQQLRRYEFAFESALSGIAIASLDGELTSVNPAFLDMWGYENKEDILGKSATDVWEHAEKAATAMNVVQETGRWEGEIQAVRADGSTFDARGAASYLRNSEDEPIGLIASFVDITERKEREHQLAAEQEKYSTLVERTHDGIAIIQDEEFVFANSRFMDIIGYEEADILGMPFIEVIAPSDRQLARDRYERRLDPEREDPPSRYRLIFETREGNQRVAEVSVARIQYEGAPADLASIRDVTDQQQYKADLEQLNEELEILNRVIRHDIRNDMAVILGWTEMLEEYIDETGEEYLEKITTSGDHVVELTEIAQDYVETLTSDDEMAVYPTRLRPILQKEITHRQEAYSNAEISVQGSIPDIEVQANEMLSSVFRNLLNNAVQHNDKDIPVVEIDVEKRKDDVRVTISDNGPGVPESQRETIFGKGERSLESSGTGIGLYLVQSLIEEYNGDIQIEDNEPVGAAFTVTLPKPN